MVIPPSRGNPEQYIYKYIKLRPFVSTGGQYCVIYKINGLLLNALLTKCFLLFMGGSVIITMLANI